MNNFAKFEIIGTISNAVDNKLSVKQTALKVSQIGADGFLSKSDFIREAFIPALEELNNGYNLECVSMAGKVLAKIAV